MFQGNIYNVSLNLQNNEKINVQGPKLFGHSCKTWAYHHNYQTPKYLFTLIEILKTFGMTHVIVLMKFFCDKCVMSFFLFFVIFLRVKIINIK